MEYKVYCEYEDYAMRLSFYIFRLKPDGGRDICTSLDKMEFEPYETHMMAEPTFTIKGPVANPFMQAMADALKKVGITAEGEPVNANELAATQYHLKDMRELVFNKFR